MAGAVNEKKHELRHRLKEEQFNLSLMDYTAPRTISDGVDEKVALASLDMA